MPYRPPGHTFYVTDRKMRPRKEEGIIQDHTENQGTEPGLESGALVGTNSIPTAGASDGRLGYPG